MRTILLLLLAIFCVNPVHLGGISIVNPEMNGDEQSNAPTQLKHNSGTDLSDTNEYYDPLNQTMFLNEQTTSETTQQQSNTLDVNGINENPDAPKTKGYTLDSPNPSDQASEKQNNSGISPKILDILKQIITELEKNDPNTEPTTKTEAAAEEELMQDIGGLIFEETMTKIGYEFYEYFFLLWEPPEVKPKDYNILITEMASARWGSWITVVVNDTPVWNMVLRPRSADIEDAVNESIEVTKDYLYNYEKYQFQSKYMGGNGI